MKLLNEKETAKLIGMSDAWLQMRRHKGDLPELPFVRIGRAVRYRQSDIENFIASRESTHIVKR